MVRFPRGMLMLSSISPASFTGFQPSVPPLPRRRDGEVHWEVVEVVVPFALGGEEAGGVGTEEMEKDKLERKSNETAVVVLWVGLGLVVVCCCCCCLICGVKRRQENPERHSAGRFRPVVYVSKYVTNGTPKLK